MRAPDRTQPALVAARLVDAGGPWASDRDRATAERALESFLDQLMQGLFEHVPSLSEALAARIAQLDALVTRQLEAIMQAPPFRALESSWTALEYLVSRIESGDDVRIKLLDVSKQELLRDLQRAPEFDQSQLFRLVYEQELGSLGGEPFTVLVADYYIGSDSSDVELLEKCSQVAAAAWTFFVFGVAPGMFRLSDFDGLKDRRGLSRLFDAPMYAKWRAFRASADACHVGLALPRILLREPISVELASNERAEHGGTGSGSARLAGLWGNAAFAVGACLLDGFRRNRWFGALRDEEEDALVEGLAEHQTTDEFENTVFSPVEVLIGERHHEELVGAGFIPLLQSQASGAASLPVAPSAHQPRWSAGSLVEAQQRVALQMRYVLSVGRIAHHIGAILRIKQFHSRDVAQAYLDEWLAQYVQMGHEPTEPTDLPPPFVKGSVEVVEARGLRGGFRAKLVLEPRPVGYADPSRSG